MSKKILKSTKSAKETLAFGKKTAQALRGGEVIGLVGPLGAGKTVFIKGLAAGLGIKETITSPTFLLLKEYEGKILKLVHVDAYRLKKPQELLDIGLAEHFGDAGTVVVVEWADKVKKILPGHTNWISLRLGRNNQREIYEKR